MQAKWGIAWLVTAIWFFALIWVPAPGLATDDYAYRSLPILPIEAQSSLETQMLGEKTCLRPAPISRDFTPLRLCSSIPRVATPVSSCLSIPSLTSPFGITGNQPPGTRKT